MKSVHYLLLGTICLMLTSTSFGQYKDLTSPQKAVITHLKNLQDDSYYPKVSISAFDWTGSDLSTSQKIKIAVKLKQVYDGEGYYIEVDKIPNNPDYRDSARNNILRYVVYDVQGFEGIYLEKVKGEWKYAVASIKLIPKKFKHVYPFGLHVLVDWTMGFDHNNKYLGLYVYQHVGIFLLLVLAFIFHKLLTLLFKRIFGVLIYRWGRLKIGGKYILPVARPFSLLLVFYMLAIMVPVLQLPASSGHYVIIILRASLPFFGMMVFYKLVDVLVAYLEKLAERTESTLDDQLVPLLRKALKVFVVIIGVLFILANFDFDVTALVAGLGVGGLAVALAAQDMLKNFFGSIMIFMDRPFQIGDWVTGNGIDGDIEEVGFRATRIRTFHNSLIYVPNGMLADMTIDNMGMRKYRRYKTYIAVTYDCPPDLLDAFVEGLKKIVENHKDTRKDYYNIYVNSFNSSSVDILFYIFFAVATWPEELKARHEINLEIMRLAEALGVRFAFPTQTLHVEDIPGQLPKTPTYNESREEMDAKVDAYFNKDSGSKSKS